MLCPSYTAAFLPADTFYSEQWALSKIKAPQAWDLSGGGSSDVVIAILDSGVDIDHPDLKENIWINVREVADDGLDNDNNGYVDDVHGWDFIQDIADPRPKLGFSYTVEGANHGTIVAGVAAASGNNGQGITGVAWKSKIMPLRVLSSEGTGHTSEVIKAIDYAREMGADIINLSFVGHSRSEALLQAIERAWQAGVLIVAASGNEGGALSRDLDEEPVYPICLDGEDNMVVGVAAVDKYDRKADFSNYGAECIDITAPGSKAYSTLFYAPAYADFQEYYSGYWSGTSIATPIVSGVAALIKSVNPQLSGAQLRDILLEHSEDISTFNSEYIGQLGQGRVSAYQAVKYAYEQARFLPQTNFIVTGAGPGGGPHIRIFKSNGIPVGGFFAFDKEEYRAGISVAGGDIDGDGTFEIIVGAGPGQPPIVRVFNQNGLLLTEWLAYGQGFRGGIRVAVGDIDGDGKDEIVTGAGPGGGPHIRVFDGQGHFLFHFFAYDEDFRGGVNIALGDLDIDGKDEIITGAGPGGGPHIRVFDGQGQLRFHFFSYLETFRGGIEVAAGDVDGDGKANIIVGIASEASPYIRVYDENKRLRCQFLAYDRDFYGGVNIIASDLDDDGRAEIISAPRHGDSPEIKIFDEKGQPISQFSAYSELFLGGVSLGAL